VKCRLQLFHSHSIDLIEDEGNHGFDERGVYSNFITLKYLYRFVYNCELVMYNKGILNREDYKRVTNDEAIRKKD